VVITGDTAIADPNIEYFKGATFEAFQIKYPLPGEWQVSTYGTVLPPAGEDIKVKILSQPMLKIFLPMVIH
jgi:hypothetical protein